MSILSNIQQINRELADKLVEEARRDPHLPYAGRYVGIANGQIVVVTDNLNDLVHRLEQVEPDPSRTFCVEPGRDFSKVHEIWELR